MDDPEETKTTSPPRIVADKIEETEKTYLHIPGTRPKKKNRFNVVKVGFKLFYDIKHYISPLYLLCEKQSFAIKPNGELSIIYPLFLCN